MNSTSKSTTAAELDASFRHDDEWYERRRRGIGGSDVYSILSGDALRIYHSKTRPQRAKDDDPLNVDRMRGRLMEPVLADLWAEARGRKIRRQGQRSRSDAPWAVVNIDRLVLATDDEPTALMEVKAPRREIYNRILVDGIREPTVLQMYHGLFVTGYERAFYVTGHTECSPMMLTFAIEYDAAIIEPLEKLLERFWNEHVLPRVPPDPDEWNVLGREIVDALPDMSRDDRPPLEDEIEWAAELYDRTRAIESDARKRKYEAREILARAMRAANVDEATISETWRVRYSRPSPRESFDDELLRDHRPLDYDAFVRWARDATSLSDAEIEMAANSLRLDLDRFVTTKEQNPRLTLTTLKGD